MNNFTKEELSNLLALINIAPIKGQEATVVALLQQKITLMLSPIKEPEPTEKKK